tara:strand:- start:9296 stop:10165 length:870 start_codon:yes stop_codon:yes gene_type:complete
MATTNTKTLKMAFPMGATKLFAYEFGVIEMALEFAEEDYVLEVEEIGGLTLSRLSEMLSNGDVDLMFSGYSPKQENTFLQVNIPMTRGILGHRAFMIHRDKSDALMHVKTIKQLRQFCIGTGSDWPDADIMEKNGFCVERAPRNQLWDMLENKRFDLLTRAIHEAYRELPAMQAKYPEIVLNETVILAYPFDFFIYVNKQNTHLWQIVTNGLLEAYRTGAFMEHFRNDPDIGRGIKEMQSGRQTFRIENQSMDTTTRTIDARFWYSDSDLYQDDNNNNTHPLIPSPSNM